MTYKSQLKLFFHPLAFQTGGQSRQNSSISLTYTGSQPLGTTLRFFLQLLRASLLALPQFSTRVADLLNLVAKGWDTALQLYTAEKCLNMEAMTESRIVSDERLTISSTILLPKVRTKVRVSFDIAAAVGGDGDGLELSTSVEPSVRVVYGEQYHEKNMSDFVGKEIGSGFEGWESAVRELREKLIVKGAKGVRK
jgi:kinetochore protein Spc7/SPC105